MGDVAYYLTSSFLLNGALLAIEIAAVAMAGGLFLGLLLALVRLSPFKPASSAAWFYIWFIRGTPQLLQLVFLYDALPLVGIKMDTFSTAVIGFALNEAAFSAEIIPVPRSFAAGLSRLTATKRSRRHRWAWVRC